MCPHSPQARVGWVSALLTLWTGTAACAGVSTVCATVRTNLAPVVLQLKALGIDNVARFDFMSSPPTQLMMRALEVTTRARTWSPPARRAPDLALRGGRREGGGARRGTPPSSCLHKGRSTIKAT